MDQKCFTIVSGDKSFEFRCSKFNPIDALKIGKRIIGYLTKAFDKGTLDDKGEFDKEKMNLSKIGSVLLDISDDDLLMIFNKCILITEVKKEKGFTPIATYSSELTFYFDDVKDLMTDISKQIKFLSEVLGHNFFQSLKDVSSTISKPQ